MNRREFMSTAVLVSLFGTGIANGEPAPARTTPTLRNLPNCDTFKIGEYLGWNVYKIPWDGQIKIAATRYELFDMRSPVVHKSYLPVSDVWVREQVCIRKVRKRIAEIERMGFEKFMKLDQDNWNRRIGE